MTIIGIDLGTTNSLVSYWKDGESHLIVNALGETLTPSVVGLDDKGEIIVGRAARERLQTHPEQTLAAFKRHMGSTRQFRLGKLKLRAEELSAMVLRSLKADAEAFLGETVSEAVISVPAYFSDAQRKATRAAGELAGLRVLRLINEPTAAAIAYGLHEKPEDTTFLVFDIGGGTFDVSILELFDGIMHVHASAGDNRLGGEDFVDELMKQFSASCRVPLSKLSGTQLAALRHSAEQCKHQLSRSESAEMVLVLEEQEKRLRVTRDDFAAFAHDLLARLRAPLERALKDADLNPTSLDAVVLVGGASRMPIIRSLASRMLGQIPTSHINPDEIVARGAAVLGGMLARDEALEEVVLTDVAPYTLGVGIYNANAFESEQLLMSPIIERNSPVPVSRSGVYHTVSANQREVVLGIYQGEARLVTQNIKLGELKVRVPAAAAGKENIDVRFTYDINGILQVEARVLSTGQEYELIIQDTPGALSESEIRERLALLASLKIHPRDQLGNTTLMARGERLYENARGALREEIGAMLSQFEAVLNRQDEQEVKQAARQLTELFDDIEKDSPLY